MKRLIGNSLVYAIGNAANSAALFLVIPFLINTLSPAEYGAWSIFEIATFLLYLLILAGLEVGLMRQYWFQSSEHGRARIVGTTILAVTGLGLLVVGVGTALILTGVGNDLSGTPLSLLLVLWIGWSDALVTLFLTLFRIREQAITFVTLSLGRLLLFALLIALAVSGGMGLIGALAARLIASVVTIGVGWFIARRLIVWQFDRAFGWQIAAYGLPLLPTNLAAYVLLSADRYILQSFFTLEDVAIYTFAYKVATILDVLITRPFALDWASRRFKIATQPEAEQNYAYALVFYLWVVAFFGLMVVAVTPLVYALVAPATYHSAMAVVPIILLAYIIYGLSYPLNVGIMLKDRTRDLPVIGFIAAFSYIGLCLWWIPAFDMIGAAWATVVAYVVWTGLITVDSLHLYPIRYPLGLIAGVAGAAAIGYGGLWLADQWWPDVSVLAIVGRLVWVGVVMGGYGIVMWQLLSGQRLAQLLA
ncbi:lipopolysaccharide biosynthesis protein [uncultured Chloroflexus sp.]|uniref:lipopolysaccharide biosynthesis protein n=1 Tax=uncultured Chloroflexus sp. TaxID=214040 RepID=UPI00262C7BB3|nr:polysaccharide biosynthesis C-terminal domain-containing protein [uncultured Chloroflexus sp.]